MRYFSNLPTINYFIGDQYVKLKNIFYQLKIEFVNSDQLSIYRIDGVKRLDTISNELYGTTEYWWLIALTNDIKDIIFDIPVDDEILREIAKRTTLESYASLLSDGALDFYNTKLDELILDNNNKRILKVISKQQIGDVIAEISKRL